jgi:uncharacterized membrane protein YoaK (UPF0700 family)
VPPSSSTSLSTSQADEPAGSLPQDELRHRRALRLRQTLVVALAVVSGATDAIGLLVLGGAFTSVMTGNMVLLGVAASSADGTLAASSGFAILAFCAGAALGARLAGTAEKGDRIWPRPVTIGLTVESLFVAGYAAGWWVTGGSPHSGVALALLLSTAIALGIQSSTVQRFGVSGMSTTYLTGTLTTVIIRLVSGRPVRDVWHSVEILLGLVLGAAAGTALVLLAPMFAPTLQLLALGTVVLIGFMVAEKA